MRVPDAQESLNIAGILDGIGGRCSVFLTDALGLAVA